MLGLSWVGIEWHWADETGRVHGIEVLGGKEETKRERERLGSRLPWLDKLAPVKGGRLVVSV